MRQCIQAADQHGDRHHLVYMAGNAEQHEQHDLPNAIRALAQAFQLLDQVEKRKQREQRNHHQHDAGDDFLEQVAAKKLHLRNRLGISGKRNSRR